MRRGARPSPATGAWGRRAALGALLAATGRAAAPRGPARAEEAAAAPEAAAAVEAASQAEAIAASQAEAIAASQAEAIAAAAAEGEGEVVPRRAPRATEYAPPLEIVDGSQKPDGATTLESDLGKVNDLSDAQVKVYEYNKRIQTQNNAPPDFPLFVREQYDMKVFAEGFTQTPDGLIFRDFAEGSGSPPVDGQQVVFNYTGYNESGAKIDSSYKKGAASETQLGVGGMIPGFELALKGMRPGGQRRVVIVPELGPPVGPSTFFSAKQYEVFDIELLEVRDCRRQQVGMFSKVVCV